MLPEDLTMGRLFKDSNGLHLHELILINKYLLGFQISYRQRGPLEIIKNTGNAQGGGSGGDQDLKTEIRVLKDKHQKLDSAPQEFFKK